MINTKKTVKEFVCDLNPLNVLDIGCGKAKIARRFIKKGANVTGVDKREINNDMLRFNHIKEDIRTFVPDEDYDLVLASFVLHFLKKNEALDIIEKIKKHTLNGGYNLLICMSNKDNFFLEKPENFYPSLEELKEIYSGWDIAKVLNDVTEIEEHGDYGHHRHDLIFLLARKNG